MDSPFLIVEVPALSDEVVVGVYDFLHAFMNAFESHYFSQLQRYYRQSSDVQIFNRASGEQDFPF